MVEAAERVVLSQPTVQGHSKRSFLSRLNEVFTSIFGSSNSDGYSKATSNNIKENLHILQENQKLQSQQIQDEFALFSLTRVEPGPLILFPPCYFFL